MTLHEDNLQHQQVTSFPCVSSSYLESNSLTVPHRKPHLILFLRAYLSRHPTIKPFTRSSIRNSWKDDVPHPLATQSFVSQNKRKEKTFSVQNEQKEFQKILDSPEIHHDYAFYEENKTKLKSEGNLQRYYCDTLTKVSRLPCKRKQSKKKLNVNVLVNHPIQSNDLAQHPTRHLCLKNHEKPKKYKTIEDLMFIALQKADGETTHEERVLSFTTQNEKTACENVRRKVTKNYQRRKRLLTAHIHNVYSCRFKNTVRIHPKKLLNSDNSKTFTEKCRKKVASRKFKTIWQILTKKIMSKS